MTTPPSIAFSNCLIHTGCKLLPLFHKWGIQSVEKAENLPLSHSQRGWKAQRKPYNFSGQEWIPWHTSQGVSDDWFCLWTHLTAETRYPDVLICLSIMFSSSFHPSNVCSEVICYRISLLSHSQCEIVYQVPPFCVQCLVLAPPGTDRSICLYYLWRVVCFFYNVISARKGLGPVSSLSVPGTY